MDRDLFIIILVGGLLTFATYYYAYQSGKGLDLWGGVDPQYRIYFTVSAILAGIVFVYLFYYYVFYREEKTKNFKDFIHISMGFIVFGSALWVPTTFLGLRNPKYKILSILSLLIVSVGSLLLYLVTLMEKENDKKNSEKNTRWVLAIGASLIFAFHVTFFDLLTWGSLYISKKSSRLGVSIPSGSNNKFSAASLMSDIDVPASSV